MGISNLRVLNLPSVEIPPSWKWAKLDEICNGIFDCPHTTPKLVSDSPFLVVRTQDILTGIFRYETAGHVSEETYIERIRRAEPVEGDLLYSREGTYFGIAAEVPQKVRVCLGQRMMLIRPKHELVDSRFLRYWLNSPLMSAYIYGFRDGSVAERLNLPTVRGLPIALPSIQIQRAIAKVLGALDDKFELNRHINKTLESMVRAEFRQCFLENVEVGKLGNLCESTIGGDWGEEQEFADSVPVICLRGVDLDNLRKEGFSEDAPVRWVKKLSLEKRQLSDCDVLIAGSGIGPVGKPLWVSPEMLNAYSYPVIYSNFVKRFRAKSPEYAVYVDRILFNMRESNEIWDYVNGTSIPNLDDKALLDYSQTAIPSEDKLKAFYEYVIPIYAKLYNKESRTLSSLRDTLLPKLMRGEVRVKDVEKEL